MAATPLPEMAYELRMACLCLARRLRYTKTSIAPHFFSVLARLERADCTAAELAARERVSAPSMSRTVAELLERGLVTRQPDPTDKRRFHIAITESGLAALREGRMERNQWMVERLATLPDSDIRTLADATKILRTIMDDDV